MYSETFGFSVSFMGKKSGCCNTLGVSIVFICMKTNNKNNRLAVVPISSVLAVLLVFNTFTRVFHMCGKSQEWTIYCNFARATNTRQGAYLSGIKHDNQRRSWYFFHEHCFWERTVDIAQVTFGWYFLWVASGLAYSIAWIVFILVFSSTLLLVGILKRNHLLPFILRSWIQWGWGGIFNMYKAQCSYLVCTFLVPCRWPQCWLPWDIDLDPVTLDDPARCYGVWIENKSCCLCYYKIGFQFF